MQHASMLQVIERGALTTTHFVHIFSRATSPEAKAAHGHAHVRVGIITRARRRRPRPQPLAAGAGATAGGAAALKAAEAAHKESTARLESAKKEVADTDALEAKKTDSRGKQRQR